MPPWTCSQEGCQATSSNGQVIHRISDPLDEVLVTACLTHLPELQASYAAQKLKKKWNDKD